MFMPIRKTAFYADLSLVFLSNKQPNETGNELFLVLRASSRTPCSHAKKNEVCGQTRFYWDGSCKICRKPL